MTIIDSHCHLNLIDLEQFDQSLDQVVQQARDVGVGHFLCVCVTLDDYPTLKEYAQRYDDVSISVGIHPNTEIESVVSAETLAGLADYKDCIAMGETGLDYYRTEHDDAISLQQQQFRAHIQAAIHSRRPLIIHTRHAAVDTIKIMREENAQDIGGVMHCFAEDLDIAKQAIDLNFYISFSGIVSFKNAKQLHEVAKAVPLDRILIETDSPYLAPVPYRGKQNHPALVKHVAEALADHRGMSFDEIAQITTDNFYRCFPLGKKVL